MTQKPGKEKQEQDLARMQRQELKAELADNYAQLPRRPRNRRRMIAFVVLGVIALLAGVFGWLVLLPSSSQQSVTGIAAGAGAPEFTLPIYGGSGVGGSIDRVPLFRAYLYAIGSTGSIRAGGHQSS